MNREILFFVLFILAVIAAPATMFALGYFSYHGVFPDMLRLIRITAGWVVFLGAFSFVSWVS